MPSIGKLLRAFPLALFSLLFISIAGITSFGPPRSYLVQRVRVGVAVADFERRGRVDMVVPNTGTGSMEPPAFVTPVPCNPYSAAVADFDEDGNLDLVVATNDSTTPVLVLFGSGVAGRFNIATPQAIGIYTTDAIEAPIAVAVGHFDKSKHVGFAVLAHGAVAHGAVTVFAGDGRGHFTAWNTQRTQYGVHGLAVADFNQDGFDDVVVARPPGHVEILFSDGKALSSGTAYPLGLSTATLSNWQIIAADLNNDGYPDLISTNMPSDPTKHFVSVALSLH